MFKDYSAGAQYAEPSETPLKDHTRRSNAYTAGWVTQFKDTRERSSTMQHHCYVQTRSDGR